MTDAQGHSLILTFRPIPVTDDVRCPDCGQLVGGVILNEAWFSCDCGWEARFKFPEAQEVAPYEERHGIHASIDTSRERPSDLAEPE